MARARERRPAGFRLWVFQANTGARRFYERDGCTLVKLTDGADNEEREPDALYEWLPAKSHTIGTNPAHARDGFAAIFPSGRWAEPTLMGGGTPSSGRPARRPVSS